MTTGRKNKFWIALVATFVVTTLIVFGYFLPLGDWLNTLNQWTSDRGARGVLLFSGIYVVAVLLLLSSSVLTMSAGVTYGLMGGTLFSLISATIAAAIAFLMSRHVARAPVQRWLNRHRKMKAIERAVSEHEWKVIFLLRLAPIVPFGPVNYALGLANVHFRTYITATVAGLIPGTFLYTYAGYAGYAFFGGDKSQTTLQYVLISGGLIVVVVLVLFLSRMAKRALEDIEQKTA